MSIANYTQEEVALSHYGQVGQENHSLTGPWILGDPPTILIPPNGYVYLGIMNNSPVTVFVRARNIAPGDDFTANGVYDTTSGINLLELPIGDIIYGIFDQVNFQAPVGPETATLTLILGERKNG